jgi:hypothetical protein
MIEIFYQNVNRIRSKTNEIYLNILNNNYDIVCLTETNLNDSVYDCEILDNRYNIFRRDRHTTSITKKDGGGVLLGIKKDFRMIRHNFWDSDIEDLWVSITPDLNDSSKSLNICLCYLPPNIDTELLTSFYNSCIKIILDAVPTDEFIIIGDFNTPNVTWQLSDKFLVPTLSGLPDFKSNSLLEFMTLCNLKQYNPISNQNNRYLDLVFSTFDCTVSFEDPVSKVDIHHPALSVKVNSFSNRKFLTRKKCMRLNYKKCNFADLNKEIKETDWHHMLSSDDVNLSVEIFYKKLMKLISQYTPLIKDDSSSFLPWFCSGLKNCLKEKQKYHKMYKKYNNPRDYDTFSMLRSRCKKLMAACYRKYRESVESSLTSNNVKPFWNYVASRKSSSNAIPNTMQFRDRNGSGHREICELFAQYFNSVYDVSACNSDSNCQYDTLTQYNNIIKSICFTESDVLNKIKLLDELKGAGPDGVPPLIIKKCSESIYIPLTIIFNKSLKMGIFPMKWKTAHIVPVFKSGERELCENYRPISILSCCAKLFESLVYDVLYHHVRPYIAPNQHGFVKNKSTTSNLLEYKSYLCIAFAGRGQVDSIYADFSKAFDRVNHALLGRKLEAFGVCGSLLRWIESYLNRRSQLVALKGELSTAFVVPSGVPQGSHLGPLFFILFINDLVNRLSCPCLLYADDLKIYNRVSSINDAMKLQRDLDSLEDWCRINRMTLNASKCYVVTFTRKITALNFTYSLGHHNLIRKLVIRDLGVYFDAELSFRPHYEHIAEKSSRMLGFIYRVTRGFKKVTTYLTLYYALVRSLLEYNTPIWSPFYNIHIDRIEQIQKRFLRLLCFRFHLYRTLPSYEDKLNKFNMVTLSTRRKHLELLLLYKVINYKIDSPYSLSLLDFNICYRLRKPKLFVLNVFYNNTSYFNPITRMCRLYNELVDESAEIDIFDCTLYRFKRNLRNCIK